MVNSLKIGSIVRGTVFPEPIQLVSLPLMRGQLTKLAGRGLQSGQYYERLLDAAQIDSLEIIPEKTPYDGNSQRFRLGIEALRLGLAYEYDPYFSLSIARIDPLPHQLEAVYDYFLKLPRIRFLLADDPGAGKTIMAGLLLKELKIRGLVQRTLIVTPANLTFQWQREMRDKFRESFDIVRGDILRSQYGANPWQERQQAITSISWVSRMDDARESLLRSHWDLIIVDEAHKMSAYSTDKKTLAYQLGEQLGDMTDHYLLMTATPHKGDPENFCLFLSLLDRDVYGDVESLEVAMEQHQAPFYLRRTKEALVSFPDPETGEVKRIFTRRQVETIDFQIDLDEMAFYESLTSYVEDQSIKAAQDDSARGRALGFTMAMLQRRFASSIYAVRRSLERMRDRRQRILDDPEGYRREQLARRIPDDFDELSEDEQLSIIAEAEEAVATIDPSALHVEITQLTRLIRQAQELEMREVESKLVKLKGVLREYGVFDDPKMKLLIFTEHKETLDYLVTKLREWGLTVTQIHGGMKIGDRKTPETRIFAEREFKEDCQVLVATEAAGEGINLQFCWFMINYDIPWNPIRLEQRMGRIHRYGQEKDCLILNFVTTNTREGRVLQRLFERVRAIETDLDPQRTGKVFNVLGDVFPANQLEKMLREMYVRNLTEDVIKARIVQEVDRARFEHITHSTLEGLAKRELNLSSLIGRQVEARERRLVPEVVESFFLEAAPFCGIQPQEVAKQPHHYRVGRVPRTLWSIGERLEPRFGELARDYKTVVFTKEQLQDDPTLEWVTPGHPLFETVRESLLIQSGEDLQRGTVFYDVHLDQPIRLEVFEAAIVDGRGHPLHRRLFVMQVDLDGTLSIRQPTLFLDILPADEIPDLPSDMGLPTEDMVEDYLVQEALIPFLEEIRATRLKETETIRQHMEISLNALLDRLNLQMGDLTEKLQAGVSEAGLEGRLKAMEDRFFELQERLYRRREELALERECTIGGIERRGQAWVLPHPERYAYSMVRDEEVERIAVEAVIAYEQERGWQVQSVEKENRGFDLISRKLHPEDPSITIAHRFIEVKGRAGVGEVALTANEYRTAQRLGSDYWLYVVYNCANQPEIHPIQDPAQLGWQPIVKIEHYQISADAILGAS